MVVIVNRNASCRQGREGTEFSKNCHQILHLYIALNSTSDFPVAIFIVRSNLAVKNVSLH